MNKVKKILEQIKITPLIDTLYLGKIPDEVYFSSDYKEFISNSRLTLINSKAGGSCQKFLDGLNANNEYNPSFLSGSAVHCSILQPELFMLAPALERPSAKAGMMADIIYSYKDRLPTLERLKDAAVKTDYYHGIPTKKQLETVRNKMMNYLKNRATFDENNVDDREVIYLDDKMLETVKNSVQAISDNTAIQELLHPTNVLGDIISENEQAITVKCEISAPGLESFTVNLKSKLDNYTIDPTNNIITINDVKTHGRPIEKFGDAVESFSYWREMAFYRTLLELVAKKYYNMTDYEVYSNFLAVQTYDPFPTCVYSMTPEMWKKGKYHFMYLLRLASLAMYFKDAEKYKKYIDEL